MQIHEIIIRMIEASGGNCHDICHFLKVHSYAQIIGRNEHLDAHTQFILEAAAIVHDIACPLCREKYGSAPGNLQEKESEPLVRAFFAGCDIDEKDVDRIVFLVTHHHTCTNVNGADHQILLESDYLVNADEGSYSRESTENFCKNVFRTATGKQLLHSIYLSQQ